MDDTTKRTTTTPVNHDRARALINYQIERNRWTIDRAAVELGCSTPDLRWLLAGYPAESARQQMRLDAIVGRSAALQSDEPTRPTLMRRAEPQTGKRPKSDYCKNGHWLGDRSSHYISRSGKRMCYQCIEGRRVARGGLLAAAKSAIGTLNARGLRDVEIARVTGISSAAISDWRRGVAGITSERANILHQLVAVTNDLTGKERPRTRYYAPHPMIDEIRARFDSVTERVAEAA